MTTRGLLSLLLAVAPLACGDPSTTGHTVVLHTRMTTDLSVDRTVTTGLGWTVTVKRALIASGALYYFDGEPAFTLAPRRGRWRPFWEALSPVGTAWAHPGHYIAGSAHGEMLLPFSADLLAGASTLPDGDGITGQVRSGTFSFAPPTAGPAVANLGGHVAVTEGSATRDGKTINFVLTADMPDVSKNARDGKITGCPFTEVDLQADGTTTVTIKPKIWFDLVDFSELAPGTPETPTVADATTTAHIAFALGLVQLSAYQFAYSANSNP